MIVFANKGYQTRSDCPNLDWTEGEAKYVVEDGSALAKKIQELYPNYEFVEEGGLLVDVEEVAPPEPSEEEKRLRYEARTVELIREQYDMKQEAEVLREYLVGQDGSVEAFQLYNQYVLSCKQMARQEVYGDAVSE